MVCADGSQRITPYFETRSFPRTLDLPSSLEWLTSELQLPSTGLTNAVPPITGFLHRVGELNSGWHACTFNHIAH